MKLILALLLCLSLPVYAHDRNPPTIPPPQNVPDNSDSHTTRNLFLFSAIVFGAWCVHEKCWQDKPVKVTGSSVPESPQNEYLKVQRR